MKAPRSGPPCGSSQIVWIPSIAVVRQGLSARRLRHRATLALPGYRFRLRPPRATGNVGAARADRACGAKWAKVALLRTGMRVHLAAATRPLRGLVAPAARARRPHVMDLGKGTRRV